MGPQGSKDGFSRAGIGAPVRPTIHQGQQGTQEVTDDLNPAPEEEVAGEDGLSHDGEPEVEVIEKGDVSEAQDAHERPRVLKAPRAPTQKEIDEHMATHLPHEEWCDVCMKGRCRNTPHRKKVEDNQEGDADPNGSGSGPLGSKGARVLI